jgi:hypothetical protein
MNALPFLQVMTEEPNRLASLFAVLASTVFQGALIVAFLRSATRELRSRPSEWADGYHDLCASTNPEEKTNYLEVLVAARHKESAASAGHRRRID